MNKQIENIALKLKEIQDRARVENWAKTLKEDLIATLKKNWGLIIFTIIAFIGAGFIWFNSPAYKEKEAEYRQHVIDFLYSNQFSLPFDMRDDIMRQYNITFDDLKVDPSVFGR